MHVKHMHHAQADPHLPERTCLKAPLCFPDPHAAKLGHERSMHWQGQRFRKSEKPSFCNFLSHAVWEVPKLVAQTWLRTCACAHLSSLTLICVVLRPTAFRTTARCVHFLHVLNVAGGSRNTMGTSHLDSHKRGEVSQANLAVSATLSLVALHWATKVRKPPLVQKTFVHNLGALSPTFFTPANGEVSSWISTTQWPQTELQTQGHLRASSPKLQTNKNYEQGGVSHTWRSSGRQNKMKQTTSITSNWFSVMQDWGQKLNPAECCSVVTWECTHACACNYSMQIRSHGLCVCWAKGTQQKRHIRTNHINFLKSQWTVGCPWGTRPVSRQKQMRSSVSFSIGNNRKSLGDRPVEPCLSPPPRVFQGHPAGVPRIVLKFLCASFLFWKGCTSKRTFIVKALTPWCFALVWRLPCLLCISSVFLLFIRAMISPILCQGLLQGFPKFTSGQVEKLVCIMWCLFFDFFFILFGGPRNLLWRGRFKQISADVWEVLSDSDMIERSSSLVVASLTQHPLELACAIPSEVGRHQASVSNSSSLWTPLQGIGILDFWRRPVRLPGNLGGNILCFRFQIKAALQAQWITIGCGFFAYNWKLPAYSGAFLLTIDNFSFCAYNWSFFAHNFSFFACSWSIFAYSGNVRLIRALRDCKQRSLTVSKKAPTVSKKTSPITISNSETICWCHCGWNEHAMK